MSYTGTQAIIGKGTVVSHSATSAGSYVAFNEVLKVSFPSPTTKFLDATNMDSTGNYEEVIAGFMSAGEVNIEANYLKGDVATLYTLLTVKTYFKITLPDASAFAFAGFVDKPNGDSGFGDKVTTKFSIKITGAPTFTAGA